MTGLRVRRATPADDGAVVDLVARCLGWRPGDPNAELFRWKHRASPFGPSPAWVAEDDGRVVGFRTFMRWEFTDGTRRYRAVRAVDTATDPAYRGRGVFRDLTTRAVDELAADGVDFVFNTPNDQSLPGYLRMGWHVVGRLPLLLRVRTPVAALRTLRSRAPADLWSQPADVGLPVRDVAWAGEADASGDGRLRTVRAPEYLRWRFGLSELRYRALPTSGDPVVARWRSRGRALELAVVHVPAVPAGESARAVREALRASGADHAVALGSPVPRGMVRLPRQGPLLTARPLAGRPPGLAGWDLTLGDVELF